MRTKHIQLARVWAKRIALFALLSMTVAARCDDSPFAPPDQRVRGVTYAELAARWWQYVLAIPAAQNPVLDGPCTTGQSGDIFFLTGNFGGTSTRDCTVPPGKAIVFPAANFICYTAPDAEGCSTPHTDAELIACAQGGFDGIPTTLTVELDGEPLTDPAAYHVTSSVFSWTAPPDEADWLLPFIGPIPANTCGIPEGNRFGATDGFWIGLRPLEHGEHTLHFTARIEPPGQDPFVEDVTYHLTQQ